MPHDNNNPTGWKPKEIPLIPDNSDQQGTRVNLVPHDFDKLIRDQGVRVKVYRTSFCPRVKSIDGAEHEIDCPICKGSQFLDKYPVCTWAFIQSQNLEKSPFVEGLYDGNSVTATFMSGIELQYFTLVELTDFTDIFYERIKRQAGKLDILRYAAKRVNMLVDSAGVEYFEGIDFTLTPEGNVSWKARKGPLEGVIYTIHYEASVRFRAIKAMHVNRFGQIKTKEGTQMIKLPEEWILEKIFFSKKFDASGNEQFNTIED